VGERETVREGKTNTNTHIFTNNSTQVPKLAADNSLVKDVRLEVSVGQQAAQEAEL
jgi:hypothetical protein